MQSTPPDTLRSSFISIWIMNLTEKSLQSFQITVSLIKYQPFKWRKGITERILELVQSDVEEFGRCFIWIFVVFHWVAKVYYINFKSALTDCNRVESKQLGLFAL